MTLRLLPASPRLFDAVPQLPIMDVTRACTELGWVPRYSAIDAIRAFLDGLHEVPAWTHHDSSGMPTGHRACEGLRPASVGAPDDVACPSLNLRPGVLNLAANFVTPCTGRNPVAEQVSSSMTGGSWCGPAGLHKLSGSQPPWSPVRITGLSSSTFLPVSAIPPSRRSFRRASSEVPRMRSSPEVVVVSPTPC
jgi:hypothetical protein